jgi:tetratricopeptide (TPR) repeat protein
MVEPGRMFPVPSDWPFEAWEVAVTPLPLWLPVEGRRARAWLAVCFNSETEKILASEPGAEEEIPQLLEQVLTRAGQRWRARPAQVRVADAEVARILEDLLESQEVEVAVVARLAQLPGVVDALIAGMAPPDPRPGPLTGEGVTVERLRSFARAAADLYTSSCWRHLSPEDLIQVEAPEVEEGLRSFILTRQSSGPSALWFVSEADDVETILARAVERMDGGRGLWTLGLDLPWTAPPEDVDLWERHGLPWAGGDRCPVAYVSGWEVVERPDARQLAFLEGLLAALAATAEKDLDAGRWEKQVSTSEGPVRFVLSLPGLRETGDDEALDFETPREKAEDFMDKAYDSRGRRAVLLARRALEVWPDCAEAYNLLAGQSFDPVDALGFYAQAMAAAQRTMGPGAFEQIGRFWENGEGLPYMEARLGYAEALLKLGHPAEAVEHFQELLRLNPPDDQRVREPLVNLLIAQNRDEEAQALLDPQGEEDGEDESALMAFPRVLLGFRREGDSVGTRRCLEHALKANRFIPGLLLRTRRMPHPSTFYLPGTEEEAAVYLSLSRGTWEKTPGALDWLRERTMAATARAVRSKMRAKARGKKKPR